MRNILCFDVGGSSIKAAIVTEAGRILHSHTKATPIQGKGETIPLLEKLAADLAKQYQLAGISCSIPGAVSDEQGTIGFAGAVTDVVGVSITKCFADLGLPVAVENDANCAALAEHWNGNGKGIKHLAVITSGTGIGGGIIINDQLYTGRLGMAGEFGLMTLSYNDKLKEIINRYSFSQVASTRALLENASIISSGITGEELFRQAAENEELLTALHDFYDAFAAGITNIIHALAPEKILIGGGISAQPSIVSELKTRVASIREEAAELTEIDRCHFRNQAGVIGAAANWLARH